MKKQSPTRHTVAARLPKELAKRLKASAVADKRTVSQKIEIIVEEYLRK